MYYCSEYSLDGAGCRVESRGECTERKRWNSWRRGGGAMTRGLGKKTHGNISAGYKIACFCYCDKMYKRVMCSENDDSLNNRF